jgi:hypothetical protein
MPVVGFLNPTSAYGYAERLRAFRQGLKEIGYVEGENVAVEYRWAENQISLLPELAADQLDFNSIAYGHSPQSICALFGDQLKSKACLLHYTGMGPSGPQTEMSRLTLTPLRDLLPISWMLIPRGPRVSGGWPSESAPERRPWDRTFVSPSSSGCSRTLSHRFNSSSPGAVPSLSLPNSSISRPAAAETKNSFDRPLASRKFSIPVMRGLTRASICLRRRMDCRVKPPASGARGQSIALQRAATGERSSYFECCSQPYTWEGFMALSSASTPVWKLLAHAIVGAL